MGNMAGLLLGWDPRTTRTINGSSFCIFAGLTPSSSLARSATHRQYPLSQVMLPLLLVPLDGYLSQHCKSRFLSVYIALRSLFLTELRYPFEMGADGTG